MNYRILLDANVYVQYAAYGKIEQLVSIILDNGFLVFATNHLFHEVHEALLKPNILKSESVTPANVISFYKKLSSCSPKIRIIN